MAASDVTGKNMAQRLETEWYEKTNKANNLQEIKTVSAALKIFLNDPQAQLTIDRLANLREVCKQLQDKAADPRFASIVDRIFFGTQKLIEDDVSILRDTIVQLRFQKFNEIFDQIDAKIQSKDFAEAFRILNASGLTQGEQECFHNKIKQKSISDQIDAKIQSKDFQNAASALNDTAAQKHLTREEIDAFSKKIHLGQQVQQSLSEIAGNPNLQLPAGEMNKCNKAYIDNRFEDAKRILCDVVHFQSGEVKESIRLTMPKTFELYTAAPTPLMSIACYAIVQSAYQQRNLVCQQTKLTSTEYEEYEKFADTNRSEWAKLGPNDPPISYSRAQTGLSRSVTFVPGKGLMIHMKGKHRKLERQQLGNRGVQGVVTKAVNFHTGAVDAFKSMDITTFNQVQREVTTETLALHARLKGHPEFASGKTISYKNSSGKVKVGLFMPMMEGGDLLYKVNSGSFNKNQQVSYAIQMAKSIRLLHSLGFFHRDLKLDNVLVSKDGKTVVLADFDLAVQSSSDRVRFGVGNLQHMAPETYGTWLFRIFGEQNISDLTHSQFVAKYGKGRNDLMLDHFVSMLDRPDLQNQTLVSLFREQFGDRMTETSEVFSFGVLLYEMKVHQSYTHPGSLQQLISSQDPYDRLICSCLQRRPQDRPSMDTVITQLETIARTMQ